MVQGIADPKLAADLWVKIARWYDSALRHVDYAIASAQQALQLDNAHVGALQALEDFYRKQKRWNDLVTVLARHAEVEQEPAPRVDILLQLADTYETQIGDAAQAVYAYQRALDTDERCIDAINALERLYRRTQAWDRLVDVLAKKSQVVDDTEQAIKLKLQVGELWEDRLGDNERAVEAYKEVLSVDPQNLPALKALDTLYQKTGRMEEYLENLEHQLEVSSPEGDRVEIYQRWRRSGRRSSPSPIAPPRCWRRSCSSTTATRRPTAISSASISRSASGRRWSRPTASTSWRHQRRERAHRPVHQDGAGLRDGAARSRHRAIDAYNDVLNVEADHADALAGLARLYEETEQWDRAVEVMRRLHSRSAPTPSRRSTSTTAWARSSTSRCRIRSPPRSTWSRRCRRIRRTCRRCCRCSGIYKRRGDWLKAAQLMVRAEATTVNPLEKTRLLHEAAKIFQEKLGDEAQATRAVTRA